MITTEFCQASVDVLFVNGLGELRKSTLASHRRVHVLDGLEFTFYHPLELCTVVAAGIDDSCCDNLGQFWEFCIQILVSSSCDLALPAKWSLCVCVRGYLYVCV